jgi:hypothetical protein
MKALFSLLITAAVFSLIVADAESSETTPPASDSAETTPHPLPPLVLQFLGPEAASIIAKAERVEAFRLDPSDQPPLKPGDREISGYRIIATGQAKGKESAARLAALLLDERSYWFKGPSKICKPEPTFAFRLWHERQHADVVLCFECTLLQVNPEVYFDDFDPMRPELVKLAKAAFPRDPVIQKLPDASPFPIDSSLPPKLPGTDPKSR